MSHSQRLEFITRHFKDLQSIRFAPVPAAMLLAPFAAHGLPHVNPIIAWALLSGFLFCVVGFCWWSAVAIKRHYGWVKLSGEEGLRMERHPAIFALRLVPLAGFFFARRTYWDWYALSTVLIIMLTTILDSTNLAVRRGVWTIGLVVLFAAGPFLIDVDRGAVITSLTGVVWLSLSIFDFLLLRRTFAEVTDVVAHYG